MKTLIVFLGGSAVFGVPRCAIGEESRKEEDSPDLDQLPQDFWFRVMTRIYERFGDDPVPMQIRAHSIIKALGIPSGQFSALTSTPEAVRIDANQDKVLGRLLTNDAGMELRPERIASGDILDLYPDGLPDELKSHLDPRILAMFEARYEHLRMLRKTYGHSLDPDAVLSQEQYFRLSGGIDLLTIGYVHDSAYQSFHGDYLNEIARRATVLAIEGYANNAFEDKLEIQYETNPNDNYHALMHRAVDSGFRGWFTSVDARDTREDLEMFMSLNREESIPFMSVFYAKYFDYIRKEHPALYAEIGSEDRFREMLFLQLTGESQTEKRQNGRGYVDSRAVGKDFGYVSDPEGLEFGQALFSDALSAIKLHLIGRLMADGKIPKGPIVDIQGAAHLSNKSFFIRYPEYAMEVVLRTLPELLSYHGIKQVIEKELAHPDWSEIVKRIAMLAFARPSADPDRIDSFSYDYLGEYGIDPGTVVPSDAEIMNIMARTKRGEARRKKGVVSAPAADQG